MVGLILALKNYDPDKGYKFLSFAVWYIRREILKEIYNTGRTIRYPITYISRITKVKKAYEEFVNNNNREPTDEELIKLANVSQKQYYSTVLNKSYCQSFDTPISENSTLGDIIPSEKDSFSDNFTKETINKALSSLSPREYEVITSYYGLNNSDTKSIKEIAKEIGLGDERVRQIRKIAIKKLKQRYGNTLKSLL